MSAAEWIKYLWGLLPRPYKVYETHRDDETKTEIRRYVETLSRRYDTAQQDIIRARDNWFPQLMDARLLDLKGYERGKLIRWAGESDEEFRLRVANAFDWFALGGTAAGMKKILQLLGYKDVEVEERVTEEQWAEFAVVATLPSGDMHIQENIERIQRIINEIKAAHTRLVSTNVNYDPPDIGLDPDHIHSYDYCYYDLGLWPRPTEHWNYTTANTGVIYTWRVRLESRRAFITLVPLYDAAMYDHLYSGSWYSAHARRHMTHTKMRGYEEETWLRRWLDKGSWEDGTTFDIVRRRYRVQTNAFVSNVAFSQGVYDAGEPLGSLNCTYSPYWRKMNDTGTFGSTCYGDLVVQPELVPLYRLYAQDTGVFSDVSSIRSKYPKAAHYYVAYPVHVKGDMQTGSACLRARDAAYSAIIQWRELEDAGIYGDSNYGDLVKQRRYEPFESFSERQIRVSISLPNLKLSCAGHSPVRYPVYVDATKTRPSSKCHVRSETCYCDSPNNEKLISISEHRREICPENITHDVKVTSEVCADISHGKIFAAGADVRSERVGSERRTFCAHTKVHDGYRDWVGSWDDETWDSANEILRTQNAYIKREAV